ncbi:ATP-binding cassette sub-family C member 4 [Nematostella vectensis]|uniref:ATP-binding cassette sub-family C member 4 n=1 Tax=Nematostella vectensis TaxID=45351 RepID=UPI0020771FAC|nr:ATP-binding cassette sub-family C member 4 [Nematostella vectensis]XP_032233129.2 ATP-binding cassette sub-family C member 4 [Nematostella vectensis]XP_048579682.1 ATP-binding cassette sub-family C member 4 [Nematostella vectensis]XP_048579683.1 ATP-binding cassette sub-family C member 4 [Nematostella vectensis]XP_048579684.1 ATP-binding cassette sub-family C member 4 [Nematostella vectensis]
MVRAKYEKLRNHSNQSRENPKGTASLLSRLTYWWMNDIFRIGNERPLENHDQYPLLDEDQTEALTVKLEQAWDQTRVSPGNKRTRLLKALIRMFPGYFYVFTICAGLMGALCNVLQPVFLSMLLSQLLNEYGNKNSDWSYLYALGICLSALVRCLVLQQFADRNLLTAMRWRAATVGLIFKKVLRLSQTTLSKVTSGYVLDLVSGDVQRFDKVCFLVGYLALGVPEVAAVIGFMWYLIGWRSLSGALFMLLLVFYYSIMGGACASLRLRMAKITDRRLGLMASIVTGIRAVKMYAWEWPFRDMVQGVRRKEIGVLRLRSAILATFPSLQFSSTAIASLISLVTLAGTGTELTTYNVFVVVALLSTIRVSVCENIAKGAFSVGEFISSVERIQTFLELEELVRLKETPSQLLLETTSEEPETPQRQDSKEDQVFREIDNVVSSSSSEKLLSTDSDSEVKESLPKPCSRSHRHSSSSTSSQLPHGQLSLSNITCYWNGDVSPPALRSLSCMAFPGELVLVTGPVGCGKSTLLSVILGEIPISSGKVLRGGKLAHVSQCPWVFSGTVRSNILFGKRYDPRLYDATLLACDLRKDINSFPDRDATVIGERGTMLSGGQRTRVALARAVYADADIYLLDDPLGTVDSKVGRHLFERCIQGILSKKTRILVTHQLQYLQNADHILLMKDGGITREGSYAEISQSSEEISFLEEHGEAPVVPRPLLRDRSLEVEVWKEGPFRGLEQADEERHTGSISYELYWRYLTAGVSPIVLTMLAMMFVFVQAVLILPDVWLLLMTQMPSEQRKLPLNFYIYGGLVGVALLLSVIRASLFFSSVLNSSQRLHNEMVESVLKAPVLFFDTNPAGRIMNRFSKDIGCMDELLPDVLLDALQLILFSVGAVLLPSVLNPWLIIPVVPIVVLFVIIGKFYLKTSREIKRLEAINRSPVFAHLADTLEGLVTTRCHRMEKAFIKRFYKYQDVHNESWFLIVATVRWLALRLDLLCVIFETIVVISALLTHSGAGVTALSLIYAAQLAFDTSQVSVRQCSEVENYMTSVERVIAYTDLPSEPGYGNPTLPPAGWPHEGEMVLHDVTFKYHDDGHEVLKGISVHIKDGQKVGVVGRTGAGKSSLVRAIYRMPEPQGAIVVDDVDLGSINVQRARSAISVISQDPVLFSGTLRMNLDPFEKFTDDELWEAIEHASLKALVAGLPGKLYYEVVESGCNFSAGERQLICLARALLQKSSIIIMDEATANVDYQTDRLIQAKVREEFRNCTVITIAHRLSTIMDSDQLVVLDRGEVVETGSPTELLERRGGLFNRMYRSYQDDCRGIQSKQ